MSGRTYGLYRLELEETGVDTPSPAKSGEAYYNINIPTKGNIMSIHQIPPRLKRTLDADYGADGWTYLGHDENLYIEIRFHLSGAVISFNREHWL